VAQDQARYTKALAAGYKASFLCSDIFTAGQNEALIEKDDLKGIYPELEPAIGDLKATVDRQAKIVTVTFDDKLPPRVAAWRPYLGCAQLPIGAPAADGELLPRLSVTPPKVNFDALAWPMGDKDALAKPKGDAAALQRAVGAAFDRRTYGQGSETTAILIVQDGKIVAERYRDDFNLHMPQRTWSAAKSIAGTLIGVAAGQGKIDVDVPVAIEEWKAPGDPRAAITLDNLLRMASGLHSDTAGNRTDAIYFGGTAVDEQATGWPLEAAPGTRFRYANNDILIAVHALQTALGGGDRSLAYPFTDLFWKIGMTRTFPETDWRGNFILSSQVWTTARDLARLGLLYANDGVWQGERILPVGWRDYVRTNGPAQPASGYGYGASFWTFPKDKGLPADAIVMRGNRGQYVVVAPSQRLVIVRRGYDGPSASFVLEDFARDAIAALTRN
jgi:CubicO group peptidase (beta-lactamase class C family)